MRQLCFVCALLISLNVRAAVFETIADPACPGPSDPIWSTGEQYVDANDFLSASHEVQDAVIGAFADGSLHGEVWDELPPGKDDRLKLRIVAQRLKVIVRVIPNPTEEAGPSQRLDESHRVIGAPRHGVNRRKVVLDVVGLIPVRYRVLRD